MRFVIATLLAVVAVSAPAASASDVIVQGTTDVRDAGLLDDVIVPGFQAAYPQYTLKYIAVGTGQALSNARAGQGDAVLTHAPTQEAQFVTDGYSAEPTGRAIFYSDYVILGPPSDPAGVLSAGRHDAAAAFEAIAAAGNAGTANFVSRGDNSGTNTQEKIIWGLTNVARNNAGEPGSGATSNPSWYHKAGLGQADTVTLANQCPFTNGNCYEMTDRGTFNRLVAAGAVGNLQIVSDRNDGGARGGENLLVNLFHAYAVNPAKNSSVNQAGAQAFLDYLTSPAFQAKLATYPSATQPAFFADARPALDLVTPAPPATLTAGTSVRVAGRLRNLAPGSAPITSAPLILGRPISFLSLFTLGTVPTNPAGGFSLTVRPAHTGTLQLNFPRFSDLSPATFDVGKIRVKAKIGVKTAKVDGDRVTLSGSALPSRDRKAAVVKLVATRAGGAGTAGEHFLATKKLGKKGSAYSVSGALPKGRWRVRAKYVDAGAVDSGQSRAVTVTVR